MASMAEEEGKVFFYPPGGEGNKKRKKQKTFRALVAEHAVGYHTTDMDKREFVDEKIMSKFPQGAFMVQGGGEPVQLNGDDTFKIISQKLRDMYNKNIKPRKEQEAAIAAAAAEAAQMDSSQNDDANKAFFEAISKIERENLTLKAENEVLKARVRELEALTGQPSTLPKEDDGDEEPQKKKAKSEDGNGGDEKKSEGATNNETNADAPPIQMESV